MTVHACDVDLDAWVLGSNDAGFAAHPGGTPTRTTVVLDGQQLAEAMDYSAITDRSALLPEALSDLIARHAARRLALLKGVAPDLVAPPRHRLPVDDTGGEAEGDR